MKIDIYSQCTTLLMAPAAETTSQSNYPLRACHACHFNIILVPVTAIFEIIASDFFSVVVSCPENADFAFAKFEFDSTLVTEWNWVSTVMILIIVTNDHWSSLILSLTRMITIVIICAPK